MKKTTNFNLKFTIIIHSLKNQKQNQKHCSTHKYEKKGCCGMVLDHEKYANVTQPAGQSGYRKRLNLMTGEMSRLMCEMISFVDCLMTGTVDATPLSQSQAVFVLF